MYSNSTSTFAPVAANSTAPLSTFLTSTAEATSTEFQFGSSITGTSTASATVSVGTGGTVANTVGAAGVGLGAVGLVAALFF
jgi:hypothetical protein